jgi:hypothetical protein
MKLQENITRIKEVMGISEQIQKTNVQKPSDYLGKGGGFERQKYKGLDSETYFDILSKKKPNEIKKIRLVFPQNNWEQIALKFIKKLGVITGIFTNIDSAKNFINKLSRKGVKADEFVVGSHGSIGMLLITKEGEAMNFNNQFLLDFKNVIHSGTKVFFTACYGADYLDSLKDASEKLGVGAYGSAGLYNYITNESEKGFYWCSAQKFELPKSEFKLEPFEVDKETGSITVNVPNVKNNITNGIIKIKNGVLNGPIQPIKINLEPYVDSKELFVSSVRDSFRYSFFKIFIYSEIVKGEIDQKKISISETMVVKKRWELEKKNQKINDYLIQKFLSGEIVLEVDINGNFIDVKKLNQFNTPNEITNEFLLKNKLCKKVNKSPVSWI